MAARMTRETVARAREIAAAAIEDYLSRHRVDPDERQRLVIGEEIARDRRVFELYVPGKKPADARVLLPIKIKWEIYKERVKEDPPGGGGVSVSPTPPLTPGLPDGRPTTAPRAADGASAHR